MVRIAVDTNIFVSAFLGSKNASLILRNIIADEYKLVVTAEQLLEIRTVLLRPKFKNCITSEEVENLCDLIVYKAIIPTVYEKIYDCRDAKDNIMLEATIFGNADFLITGDQDLLVLNPYRGIMILSPADFIRFYYDL